MPIEKSLADHVSDWFRILIKEGITGLLVGLGFYLGFIWRTLVWWLKFSTCRVLVYDSYRCYNDLTGGVSKLPRSEEKKNEGQITKNLG